MTDLDDYQDPPAPAGGTDDQVGVAQILEEIVDLVERGKTMPLSSSVIVARDELLSLAQDALSELPGELQRARRLLRDRDEVRARTELEAAELLDEARAQAAHLVQRTEVVRQARNHAERIVADAHSEARRIRHEADDYVDRKLAAFEIVLDRTVRTVQAGRSRLAVVPELDDEEGSEETPEALLAAAADEGFFDQDLP